MLSELIDSVLGAFRSLLGAPNVRDGEAKVREFYEGYFPSWDKATRPLANRPSLETIPNGYDDPNGPAVSDATVPSNYRGSMISGTKRTWTAK